MATATLQTTSIRRRTSDGNATCFHCGNGIGQGRGYMTRTSCGEGFEAEADYCMDCYIKSQKSRDSKAIRTLGFLLCILVALTLFVIEGM